jgi:putative Mg2+ transporter-C (MgtC) family protein
MTQEIHWSAIALRLLLTVVAGTVLGLERSKTGHPAGLRTTLLVSLAASIAMIQVNLLINTNGKPANSYVVMDLMRLPLGILTGVGFIGAGAIVRKDELVLGITTAATMWFSTVIGLCFGGGQLMLGGISTLIGFIILWGLRPVEKRLARYQIARLTLAIAEGQISAQELRLRLEGASIRLKSLSYTHSVTERRNEFQCEVRWPTAKGGSDPPAILSSLERLPGVIELKWDSVRNEPQ